MQQLRFLPAASRSALGEYPCLRDR
jgi:hypothetical protein